MSAGIVRPAAGFVLRGVSGAIGAPFLLGGIAAVALALLVAIWSVVHRRDLLGRAAGAAAASGAGLLFFLIAAVARSTSDADDPLQARYLYVAGALLLPLVIVVIDSVVRSMRQRHRAMAPALLAAACILGAVNLWELRALAIEQAHIEQVLGGRVLGAAAQLRSGDPFIPISAPEPQLSFDVRMTDLAALVEQGWVPDVPALGEPELGLVRIQNQVGLGPRPLFELSDAITIEQALGVEVVPADDGCVTVRQTAADGEMVLRVNRPASVSVSAESYTEMRVQLRTLRGYELPAERGMAIHPGTSWLDLAATEHLVAIQPGPVQVAMCGLVPRAVG